MLQFHPLTLEARRATAADAVALTFHVPAPLSDAYRFRAGQHVVVRATIGGETLRRTYSIVTAPGGPLSIGVRVQGVVSNYLAQGLQVGQSLDVMTPNGRFSPALDPGGARRYVAFAAGSGITPILSIASTVLAVEPGSRMQLVYGNRSVDRTMFLSEVLALKDRFLTRFAVHFLMSGEPQDAEIFNGRLDAGKLRAMAAQVLDLPSVDEFFVCGPGSMVDTLLETLPQLGARGAVHVERFAATRGATPRAGSTPIPARVETVSPVEVVVRMDGRQRRFLMPSAGQSVLEAAEAAGLELPFSCRDGICATCRVKVVEGRVHMTRNQGLEPWEVDAGFALCCQAQPMTPRLVLSYDEK